jgi:carboxymethylenebutenolidase
VDKAVAAYDEVNELPIKITAILSLTSDHQDATLAIDLLMLLPNCNGRIAGPHPLIPRRAPLTPRPSDRDVPRRPPRAPRPRRTRRPLTRTPPQAFRAAFDRRVLSSVCFFATDVHSATLGAGDDSLARVREGDLNGKGELVVCFSPCVCVSGA